MAGRTIGEAATVSDIQPVQRLLEAITQDLDALRQGSTGIYEALSAMQGQLELIHGAVQTDIRGYGEMLAEMQGELVEIGKNLTEHNQQQTAQILPSPQEMSGGVFRGQPKAGWWCAIGIATGIVALGSAWRVMPRSQTAEERLVRGVDRVLVEHYQSLPSAVKERLVSIYAQAGVINPAQRQGK